VAITVAILPAAQRMLDAADERWIGEHGLLVENPLLDQIAHASDLLRANPGLGTIVRRGRSVIHRLLLPAGWHLYYRFLADRQVVEILAVWYASRGDEPPL
jgi:plasmid stabilization system protein ParE